MRSQDIDSTYRVRTISGFVNSDGSVPSGSSVKYDVPRFKVTKMSAGTYDIRPFQKWKSFISGHGSAHNTGVVICQGTIADKDSVRFLTAPAYGQSAADAPFEFTFQALY